MDGAIPHGPGPMSVAPTRRQVVPSAVLGTLIFVVTETMFFVGTISAFTISKANQLASWPPPGQPRLPVDSTAFNTGALLASGLALALSNRWWKRSPGVGKALVGAAWLLGALFVGLQGREWQALLANGLTATSSTLGSFFYLIVGGHALHAVGALVALGWAWVRLARGTLSASAFWAVQTFWCFVVLMWPVIYARVYF